MPTPIQSEDENDKNYRDFQNEVNKLKKVNEEPNPNVVRILDSGITDTGSLPFIEMEFIEGPDLGELLKEPYEPVFTIHEITKVALHISNALAHCHKCDVKHGDIKCNNIKYNERTGNYMLLDFGLALMSDEDRRTSLRHAGAIEFMAPEQNQGQILFETDVYSFGVILFELIAGVVPFPLHDSGETARNAVMVSHMETPPPDVLELRRNNMPESWSDEKKAMEMQVPQWLLSMVYTCLAKKPEERYRNGIDLHEYILSNTLSNTSLVATSGVDSVELQQQVAKYEKLINQKDQEIANLRRQLEEKEILATPLYNSTDVSSLAPARRTVPRASFITVSVLAALFGAFAFYSIFFNNQSKGVRATDLTIDSLMQEESNLASNNLISGDNNDEEEPLTAKQQQKKTADSLKQVSIQKQKAEEDAGLSDTTTAREQTPAKESNTENKESGSKYKVRSKAFFHDEPDASTKREAFIVHWNNAVLTPIEEENGFIYVVFTNHLGQTSKGWLQKKDLIAVKD
ncbi:MAG TPA: serine/threonine-protein kinase [Flavisolibacter sp.]|nr:serine/threonine-protein kinase [Flavisolibacter sp.]